MSISASRFVFIENCKMKIRTQYKKVLSDLTTPVGLFLKVREHFAEAILLESSDYSSKEDSLSFICFEPIFTFTADQQRMTSHNRMTHKKVNHDGDVVEVINSLLNSFKIRQPEEIASFSGLFGYTSYSAVQYFDSIRFDPSKPHAEIPLIRYDLYRYVYVIDHFTEDLLIIENLPEGEKSNLNNIINLVERQDHLTYSFKMNGIESVNISETDFMKNVTLAKSLCKRGDIFQVVPSRQFNQPFKGDEFNVYRALRSINPSPYLFYFDYSSFKIFGSSPEVQLAVEDGTAEIHPIAGTFARTGNYDQDMEEAEKLKADPKESAEHIMLVDLARNDLSKHCDHVTVESFKQVQFFSHVIHLTSVVTGQLKEGTSGYQVFADTFPAGTLSGAPKYRAMEIIDEMEPSARSFYGGGIGLLNFNGNLNHAIIIRSFLSKEHNLYYQAGAGIVIDSVEENELQEVNNKLKALRNALLRGEEL